MDRYQESFLKLIESKRPFVEVTLVNIRGSSPADRGAKMLCDQSGLLFGSVGGGKVEAHALKVASALLESKEKNQFATWNLQKDIGMTCGGEVSFFFEAYNQTKAWDIALFGAGHVAIEVARLLNRLNARVKCFDHRKEWCEKISEFKNIEVTCINQPQDIVSNLISGSFLVSITQGHAYDLPILNAAIQRSDLAFIGVIGSVSKRNTLFRELKELGRTQEEIAKIICPLGEPFGNNSPEEIALSIVAQLLKLRN